jgi:hypothetical protein
MPKLREFLSRRKGKAGEASATERTMPAAADGTITSDAASSEQKPDLYSTEGSIGMRVVVDPPGARLEYAQSPSYFNMKFTDEHFLLVSSTYMASQAIAIRRGHTRTESSGQNSWPKTSKSHVS